MIWQPINIAPKDGTEFQAWLVRDGHGYWEPRCRYNEDGGFQYFGRCDYDAEDWCDLYYIITPTHWMPQPAPPAEAGEPTS